MEHRSSRKTTKVDRTRLAVKPIVDGYLKAYRKLLSAEVVEDRSVTISFPFHLAGNHRIEITATKVGKDRYILSDAARTLGEVRDAGYSLTRQMKVRVEKIAGIGGLSIKEDHLVMETSAVSLGASMQKFLEAAKMIADVYLVHRDRAEQESGIIADVRHVLDSERLLYREQERMQGEIESHPFNLLVPPNGHPGLAVSVLAGQNTHALAQIWGFKCEDIKRVRENRNTKLVLVFDVRFNSWSEASRRILENRADIATPSDCVCNLPERLRSLLQS